jgi:biopolymer transport protein ExbD
MKLRRLKRFHVEVATSSLNDIMFFLLLFFLIISTLANPNVLKLMLPQASNSDKQTNQPIVVSVSYEKAYYVDKKPVSFAELESVLMQQVANSPDVPVVIQADNRLTIQDLVDVIEIGAKNNLKMVMATQGKKG